MLAVRAHAFVDLRRELARGHQDQRAYGVLPRGVLPGGVFAFALRRIFCKPLQHGQGEARGLAGAGLRCAEQVSTGKHERNGL